MGRSLPQMGLPFVSFYFCNSILVHIVYDISYLRLFALFLIYVILFLLYCLLDALCYLIAFSFFPSSPRYLQSWSYYIVSSSMCLPVDSIDLLIWLESQQERRAKKYLFFLKNWVHSLMLASKEWSSCEAVTIRCCN